MRLDKLHIKRFKNLQDVYVDFDEKSPYTVLVGGNGTGKSNLIEAIAWIFRNLDLEEPAPFDYELTYRCRGNEVKIEAERGRPPRFEVRKGGEQEFVRITKSEFMKEDDAERPLYRPAFVFGYYSGPSDRLAELFEKHRERFRKFIIKPASKREHGPVSSNSLRRLFYARTVHGQFALLAFFMNPTGQEADDRDFLREYLRIDGLDSVMFALKEPAWGWQSRKGGDERFWRAEGEVRELLSRLHDAAMTPMRMPRRMPVELAKNPQVDNLYLFLPNQDALVEVYKPYQNQYAFFTALESIDISTLLGEVVTRVKISPQAGGGAVTYRDLSEGEQQLLLVLGLLKFTAEDEALFLLDEPDTHLNPAWSVEYLGFLDRFVRRRENCHIVMATHDPLLFASLLREQVRIIRRDVDGALSIEEPEEDPQGMGIEAILTSDLFRLSSTLDRPTQELLDKRRRLSMKDGPLEEAEKRDLAELNDRLRPLAFSKTTRDPLYQLFVEAWTAQEDPEWSKAAQLSEEQRQARVILANKIVSEIRADVAEAHDDDQP
jgi:predicted ATPase